MARARSSSRSRHRVRPPAAGGLRGATDRHCGVGLSGNGHMPARLQLGAGFSAMQELLGHGSARLFGAPQGLVGWVGAQRRFISTHPTHARVLSCACKMTLQARHLATSLGNAQAATGGHGSHAMRCHRRGDLRSCAAMRWVHVRVLECAEAWLRHRPVQGLMEVRLHSAGL